MSAVSCYTAVGGSTYLRGVRGAASIFSFFIISFSQFVIYFNLMFLFSHWLEGANKDKHTSSLGITPWIGLKEAGECSLASLPPHRRIPDAPYPYTVLDHQ
jgi:hypothetical protein